MSSRCFAPEAPPFLTYQLFPATFLDPYRFVFRRRRKTKSFGCFCTGSETLSGIVFVLLPQYQTLHIQYRDHLGSTSCLLVRCFSGAAHWAFVFQPLQDFLSAGQSHFSQKKKKNGCTKCDADRACVVKQEVGISWESSEERSGDQMQRVFPSLRRYSV